MMEKPKKHGFGSIGRHLTPMVSVALVLLILGIVAALGVATRNITDSIKENLGFTLVLDENIPDEGVNAMKQQFGTAPYVSSYDFLSADEILRQEEALMEADIVDMLGVNPYQPEFNIRVRAAYASVDSIERIVASFRADPMVTQVNVFTEMVDDINANIGSVTLILVAVAVALLIVSFVLINNTVRLTIYSRRFLIHTMRLVGATAGFIRRPIVRSNVVYGLIAGLLAAGLLWLVRTYAISVEPQIEVALPVEAMVLICSGLAVCGMLICLLASVLATNKYLRQSYDDMF